MAQELKAKGQITNDTRLVYLKDEVDAVLAEKDTEIRKLKRALWLARECRAWCEVQFWFVNPSNVQRDVYHLAYTNRIHRTPVEWMAYWQKVEQLCKKKAEEYK